MMHLAVAAGLRPAIVTVDHGLRAEAAAEAEMVAQVAATLGLTHKTLHWRTWDHSGNLQDAARKARRSLIAAWATENHIASVALGHTMNDVAETFLMRLSRGAGVDGLATMAAHWSEAGILWQRPLLGVARAELREWLEMQGCSWVEDPSNESLRFERVRVRKALGLLAPLGVRAEQIAQVTTHLAEARAALDVLADQWAADTLHPEAGSVRIDPSLWSAPAETQRRVLLRILMWIAPADYAPRGAEVGRLLARLVAGQAATLAGVRFLVDRKGMRALREAKSVALRRAAAEVWDGRWTIAGNLPPGACIGALGTAGLAQCPDWRATGLPRAVLLVSPALWLGEEVIAAPFAGISADAFSASTLQPLFRDNTDALSH